LKNAEKFIEDAKILIQNSSFGHALALSIFDDEEIAKSYVYWFVVNKLIPASSIIVKQVFVDHYAKHENQIWLHARAISINTNCSVRF
jgi:AbiV family abortive infection protein